MMPLSRGRARDGNKGRHEPDGDNGAHGYRRDFSIVPSA